MLLGLLEQADRAISAVSSAASVPLPVAPPDEALQVADANRYKDLEEVSSSKNDDVEFQQEYGNNVNLSGNLVPGSGCSKSNAPTFCCLLPSLHNFLPFGGPVLKAVAAKWAQKISMQDSKPRQQVFAVRLHHNHLITLNIAPMYA